MRRTFYYAITLLFALLAYCVCARPFSLEYVCSHVAQENQFYQNASERGKHQHQPVYRGLGKGTVTAAQISTLDTIAALRLDGYHAACNLSNRRANGSRRHILHTTRPSVNAAAKRVSTEKKLTRHMVVVVRVVDDMSDYPSIMTLQRRGAVGEVEKHFAKNWMNYLSVSKIVNIIGTNHQAKTKPPKSKKGSGNSTAPAKAPSAGTP